MSKPTRGSIAADGRGRLLEKRSIALSMRGLCIAVLAAPAGYAHAQDAASPTEEITVTGSRLRRDGMSTPTPVTAVDERGDAPDGADVADGFARRRCRNSATTRSRTRARSSPAGGGSNSVNLRGIGSNRTLTVARRPAHGQRPAGRHDRRRNVADRADRTRRGRDGRRVRGVRLGRDQRRHELHFEHGLRRCERQHASRADGSPRPQSPASRVRVRDRRSARTATSSLGRLVRRGRCARHAGPGLGHEAAHCSRRRRGRAAAEVLRRRTAARARSHRAGSSRRARSAVHAVHRRPTCAARGTARGSSATTQIGGGGVDPGEDWTSLRPNDTRHNVFGHFKYDFSDDKMGFVQVLKGEHSSRDFAVAAGLRAGLGHDDLQRQSVSARVDRAAHGRRPASRASRTTGCSRTSRRRATSSDDDDDGNARVRRRHRQELALGGVLPVRQERSRSRTTRRTACSFAPTVSTARSIPRAIPRPGRSPAARTCRRSAGSRPRRKRR